MSDIHFDEENSTYASDFSSRLNEERKGLIGLVLKTGIVKDEVQANLVLIGIGVLAIIISLFLFFKTNHNPTPPPADKIIWVAGPSNSGH